ncbi:hypothetical protein GOV03_03030 [Candidatus Woesearchaeota archaeon]|nr:hypothetical protein [Candidatus Woesearchaeota archaeon]
MIDLTTAINCIEAMKENRTYDNHKIGRIKVDHTGLTYRKDQIVLFQEEVSPTDSEMCLGEYQGIEQKLTGKVTIEGPMTLEEINKQRERRSLLTTVGTTIGVPRGYVEEIKI